ncbi:unnamed protein product [Blepharisma stoltei]|uniref:Uncharacterized protein n=1 Tax=Blepharisma stoltei TaxID=1481888 RepID=A0AAU9K536_9CILI|nr:unnamed protein product [Blepharisma stoltei]
MPTGKSTSKPPKKADDSTYIDRDKNYRLRTPNSDLSIVTVQAANDDIEKDELKQTVLELKEQVSRLQQECQIYKAKAQAARPELKKLNIYKTVCDFKTGSFLRINNGERNSRRTRSTCTSPKMVYT